MHHDTPVDFIIPVRNFGHQETLVREHVHHAVHGALAVRDFQMQEVVLLEFLLFLLVGHANVVHRAVAVELGSAVPDPVDIFNGVEHLTEILALAYRERKVVAVANRVAVELALFVDIHHIFDIAVHEEAGPHVPVLAAYVAIVGETADRFRQKFIGQARNTEHALLVPFQKAIRTRTFMVLEEAEHAVGPVLTLLKIFSEVRQIAIVFFGLLGILRINKLLRDSIMNLAAILKIGKRKAGVVQVVHTEVKALRISLARIATVLSTTRENFVLGQVPDLVHLREDFAFLPVHALGFFYVKAATNPGITVRLDAKARNFGGVHMADVFHPAVKIFRRKFLRAYNRRKRRKDKKGFVQRSFHL